MIEIKLASANDIDKMVSINVKYMTENYDRDRWIDTVNHNMSYVIVDNEEIFGYILCSMRNDYCFITSLCIDEKYRQKGYATQLLNIVISQYDKLQLYTRSQNHKALNLYKKMGFVQTDSILARYKNPVDDCYVMTKINNWRQS